MKKKQFTLFMTVMVVVLVALISIGIIATYKIVHKGSLEASSSIELKSSKSDAAAKTDENNVDKESETIQNANFEELICQSAMIVGINRAIEESQTEEIEDSEEDVVEEEETKVTGYPYYIKVNYYANVVTVYGLDSSGNYTVPVKAMVCSTGKATPTSGVYGTQAKYQWKILNGGVYGQYSTRITGSILFHSVPYSTNSKNALISKYYDQLGTTASAGCVRLTTIDAKWIYDNCPIGTKVEFYSSSNPGPLGKPTAKKISSYPSYLRCWDPTDPDPSNPWLTYTETETEEENTEEEEATNSEKEESASEDDTSGSSDNNNTANKTTGNNTTGNKTTGNNTTGNKTTGNNTTGNKTTGNNTTGNKTTGNNTTGNNTTGNNTTGNNTTGNNTTGNNTTK